MSTKIISLFLLILTFACSRKSSKKAAIEKANSLIAPMIEIIGKNLSEDLSRLASNNDEILLLIYENPLPNKTVYSLFSEYFILDSENRKSSYALDQSLFEKEELLFVLAEIDTDSTIKDIEINITKNLKNLFDAFKNLDRVAQNEIIGDDDILGMRLISLEKSNPISTFTIRGVHKADRYIYNIKIIR